MNFRSFICFTFTYRVSSVPTKVSASVAISTIPFSLVVALFIVSTKFVPSYVSSRILPAQISPSDGSLPARVFIFLAPRLFRLSEQAPVLAVVNFTRTFIPVV